MAMSDYSDTSIFIYKLQAWMNDEELLNLSRKYGPVLSVKVILKSDDSTVCKGYGFIDYESHELAVKALTGLTRDGYSVRWAWKQILDITNIFISNLPDWVSEAEILSLLRQHGTVMSVRVPCNTQTRKNKGFALARMDSRQTCDRIIEIFNGVNNQDINGTTVRCVAKYANVTARRKKGRGNKTSNKEASLVPVGNFNIPHQCYPGPMMNGCSAAVIPVLPPPPTQMRFSTPPPPIWCPPPNQPTFFVVSSYPIGGAINNGLPLPHPSIQPPVPHYYVPPPVHQIPYAQLLPQTSHGPVGPYIPSPVFLPPPFNLNGHY